LALVWVRLLWQLAKKYRYINQYHTLIKPEEVTPGVANYYSSTYEGQAILVKTREGRPIKVEGNPNDIFQKVV
jgi:hypothetical protein